MDLTLLEFDPKTESFTARPETGPAGRYDHCAVLAADGVSYLVCDTLPQSGLLQMHVLGGITYSGNNMLYLKEHWLFTGSAWSKLDDLDLPVAGQACSSSEDGLTVSSASSFVDF